MEEQPWAPSGPVLGKGAAIGEATAKSPSAGVQPWAMETNVLRREYSRGQWRSKSFGGNIAVGNGEDHKSYDGTMIVGREFTAANAHRRRRPERRRRLCLPWLGEILEAMTLKRRHSNLSLIHI